MIICLAGSRTPCCFGKVDDIGWYEDTAALFEKVLGVKDGIVEDCSDAGVECLRAKDLLVYGEEERSFDFEALNVDGECWSVLFAVVTTVSDGDDGRKLYPQIGKKIRLSTDVCEAPKGGWDSS